MPSFINLEPPNVANTWVWKVFERLGGGRNNILFVPSFTVANLPSASVAGGIIYVSNEVGGAIIAFSDGTNWRRVTDRSIVA